MLNACVQVAILFLVAVSSWRTEAEIAARKLAWIQSSKLQPGTEVHFSTSELRAFARSRIPVYAPEGVRAPQLELGNGTASASALVDFLKLRHAAGAETNWLIAKIIEGERPVRVTTHIQSANGKATVFMDRVEISGVAVSGAPLDMLVDTFFRPLFPEAKINEPFPLHYGLDHVVVTPNGLTVFARK